jgi:glutamine---fructose-6-phosphate transaminase (isomerizing)
MNDDRDSSILASNADTAKTARPSWLTEAYPELRPEPPWVMEEMIASEPDLVVPMLSAPAALAVAGTVLKAQQQQLSIVTTGCGTSEHGALAVAALLEAALSLRGAGGCRVECRQAFDAWLDPRAGGILLAVSHDGATAATIAAMKAARSMGATIVLITARQDAPAARAADHLFVTPKIDRSWCHTVAYMSSVLVGTAVARAVGNAHVRPENLQDFLRKVATQRSKAATIAHSLAHCERLIITGAGADLISARELALKIEEGARLPSVAIHLETLLHGHLAATDERTGIVFLICAEPASGRGVVRAIAAAEAARRIGVQCGAILAAQTDFPGALTNAGRVVLPEHNPNGNAVELLGFTLAGSGVALQQVALELAHERGSNPDLIRREEEAYREAARIADQATW